MNCGEVKELLSPLCDGELPPERTDALREHLSSCTLCRAEFDQFLPMSARLKEFSSATQTKAPPDLWAAIEKRLDESQTLSPAARFTKWARRPLALAACVTLLLGVGILLSFFIDHSMSTAQAAGIDYRVLMDGVADDVNVAIQRFLRHYHAQPITVAQTHQVASGLSFDLPPQLPGGYRFVQAYQLKFDKSPGIAATYDRDGEPLFLIFHGMVKPLDRSNPTSCKMGTQQGQEIEAGRWRLVHMMDETTCHCVLSTLTVKSGLDPVVWAVAPALSPKAHHQHAH